MCPMEYFYSPFTNYIKYRSNGKQTMNNIQCSQVVRDLTRIMTASTCVCVKWFYFISDGYIYHLTLTGTPYYLLLDSVLLVIRLHITCYCESLKKFKIINWVQLENEFNSKALSAISNLGDKILTLGNCNRSLQCFATEFVLEFKRCIICDKLRWCVSLITSLDDFMITWCDKSTVIIQINKLQYLNYDI